MRSWREQLQHFQDMKWSEIIDGRLKDIYTWVRNNPESIPASDSTTASATTTNSFSFNTRLLSPHFANLSPDPNNLPFIEFSAIGLLRVATLKSPQEELLPHITNFLSQHEAAGEYQNLPLIIATGNRYFMYGNSDGSTYKLTELNAKFITSLALTFADQPSKLDYALQHYPLYRHCIENNAHTHFSTEPQQVAQIKKIANSAFYIKLLITQAENISFSIAGLWNVGAVLVDYFSGATYDNLYRAITHLVHTDLDFAHRFQEEIHEFLQLLERFNHYSEGLVTSYDLLLLQRNDLVIPHDPQELNTYLQTLLSDTTLELEPEKPTVLIAGNRYIVYGRENKHVWKFTELPADKITIDPRDLEARELKHPQSASLCKQIAAHKAHSLDTSIYRPSMSFQAGNAVGLVSRYIYDPEGKWDIDVFSQFSVDLPKHIDVLTTLINSNNSTVKQHAPNIDAHQLRSLQKEATKLLKTLKNTQRNTGLRKLNPLYQMYQIINYVFLLRQIFVLLNATLTQVGQLNEAYQEGLRDLLTIVKKEFIPLLAYYALHLEVEGILHPGTVFRPTLTKINNVYGFIAERIETLADFSFLGKDLLIVEDSEFLNQCESSVKRMYQDSMQARQQIIWAQTKAEEFYVNARSNVVNACLRSDYAWLAPYVKKINLKLHQVILEKLNHPSQYQLSTADIQNLHCQLSAYFQKLLNTETLRAEQCQAVRAAVVQYTQLQLFPYQNRTGCEIALKIIKNHPLDAITLPTKYPILIQHTIKSEVSYVFYGNTDGTKWGFTVIPVAYIDPGILNYFRQLNHSRTVRDPRTLHRLPYRIKFQSLYQQMILRKAHTYYQSQFSSLESEVLDNKPQNLVQLATKPIDWAQAQWKNAAPVSEADTALHNETATHRPNLKCLNQHIEYYTELEQLSAEEALTLAGWYQQKIMDYQEACRDLQPFIATINQQFRPEQRIQFTAQSAVQRQCQYGYHALRPYLIGLPNFPAFDQKMVQALSVATPTHSQALSITGHEFNTNLQSFSFENGDTQQHIQFWTKRSHELRDYAQRATQTAYDQLLPGRGQVQELPRQREGFLLHTTELSKNIRKLHLALQRWKKVLDPLIQEKLKPQQQGAPYPDISDVSNQLKTPPFILFFKRIFSAVHHLEKITIELEKIRTGNTVAIKTETINLIVSIGQSDGQNLIDISLQLRDDPILYKICKDLYDQLMAIIQQAANVIQPHTANAQKIHPTQENIALPGLWYTMNSFYTFPVHLLALTEQKYPNLGYGIAVAHVTQPMLAPPAHPVLTLIQHQNRYYIYGNGTGQTWQLRDVPHDLIRSLPIDFSQSYLNYDHRLQPLYDYLLEHHCHVTALNNFQAAAKRTTLNIEQIIRDSNHYFRLFFFDGLMIYRLNQGIQAQLELFARTTQEVVMSHLDILQDDYFKPLKLQAHTKEHEWGLIPGTIAEPLEQIIQEWYQGLIFPLKKSFQEKQAFCTSSRILEAEIEAENQRHTDLMQIDHTHQESLRCVTEFTLSLSSFKRNPGDTWTTKTLVPQTLSQMYTQTVYPRLTAHSSSFTPDWLNTIPFTLNREQLTTIKNQVAQYYERLSWQYLMHNTSERTLYQTLGKFLTEINILQSQPDAEPSKELAAQYHRDIFPKLSEYRLSSTPAWLKEIKTELNRDTLDHVLQQAEIYLAYLQGVSETKRLYQELSTRKRAYLQNQLAIHQATAIVNYRKSFAKHHMHTVIQRLPYQVSGLENSKIHRQYNDELSFYLIQFESNILQNIAEQTDVDTVLDQRLKEKTGEFRQTYFERFQRVDRLQTAINEFKDELIKDKFIPQLLRTHKLERLQMLEDLIHQPRADQNLEEFLNSRSLLLHQFIQNSETEEILLEPYDQSHDIFEWLYQCFVNLLIALGLQKPKYQQQLEKIRTADSSPTTLPKNWLDYVGWSSAPNLPATPERRPYIVSGATPGQKPR